MLQNYILLTKAQEDPATSLLYFFGPTRQQQPGENPTTIDMDPSSGTSCTNKIKSNPLNEPISVLAIEP